MAFTLRSNSDVLKEFLTELKNSGINYLPQGSKARAMAAVFAREIDVAYKFFDSNFDQAYLNFASGELLEALGTLFNVPIIQAQKAYSSSVEQNVTFYVQNGATFGSINSGADITIPAGTIISTSQTTVTTQSIQYQLLNDVLLASTEVIGFGTVESLIEGAGSNVGVNTLNTHDFTGYTLSNSGQLRVTNRFAVLNGVNKEADNLYRARVAIAATALQRGNQSALRFALLSVPGVVDIRLLNYFDGIGTVGAFIAGQDNETPPSLLTQAQFALDNYSSAGEVVSAYAPNKVGVEIATHVNTSRTLTQAEADQIERKLLDAVFSYFTSLRISEEADLNVLIRQLQKTDSLIVDFGTTSSTTQLDVIAIYRYSDASNERVRKTLLNTVEEISIENHEILVPEISLDSPFSFSFDVS